VICGMCVSGMWYVVCGMWHMIMWYVACGMWHVACGMWYVVCGYVICGMWLGYLIYLGFRNWPSINKISELCITSSIKYWLFDLKARVNEWLRNSDVVQHRGHCRPSVPHDLSMPWHVIWSWWTVMYVSCGMWYMWYSVCNMWYVAWWHDALCD
jgi:hypothetical protein